MILDVGCGVQPKGDINCDLYIKPESREKGIIEPKKIKNFILCDAEYLPFRNSIFTKVVCHHVIEHVKHPVKLLKELYRVSKLQIEIICPHRLNKLAKVPYHQSHFNTRWFNETLHKLNFLYYRVDTSNRFFPTTSFL